MSLVNYYYQLYEKLFWGDLKVTRAQDFFLVNSSWGLPLILVIQLTFVVFLGPKWMSTRKPFDLRPFLIVINGLHFGAYGCGILVIGYGISLGRDSWACTAKPSDDFRDDVMLRIAYALFCMRILELTTPVIMVLRGKSDQSSIANSLYNGFYILIIYHCMNRYYKDMVYLYPYTDAMKITLRSGYYSLTSPGPNFRRYNWPKHYVTIFSLIVALFNVYHLIYLIANNCDGPKVIMFSFLTLALGEIIFYFIKLNPQSGKKIDQQSIQKLANKLD